MSKRLLIADDEPDATTVLQYRLEQRGFSVDTCLNGGEALDKALANEYDAVIVDYFMPILKGDLVCQSLRCEERLKGLPVFIITAFQNYPEEYFKEKGATGVFYKPFEIEDLVDRLNSPVGAQIVDGR